MLVAQNEVSEKNEESIGLKSFSDVSIFFIKHHEITQHIPFISKVLISYFPLYLL